MIECFYYGGFTGGTIPKLTKDANASAWFTEKTVFDMTEATRTPFDFDPRRSVLLFKPEAYGPNNTGVYIRLSGECSVKEFLLLTSQRLNATNLIATDVVVDYDH